MSISRLSYNELLNFFKLINKAQIKIIFNETERTIAFRYINLEELKVLFLFQHGFLLLVLF